VTASVFSPAAVAASCAFKFLLDLVGALGAAPSPAAGALEYFDAGLAGDAGGGGGADGPQPIVDFFGLLATN
jgi:hypothetical protein